MIHFFMALMMVTALWGHPGAARAQSTAKAPILDTALKSAIRSMIPLTDMAAPPLENKPVLITFFASWCPPCRPEFAELNSLRKRYPSDKLEIVAINVFESHFDDPGQIRMKRFLRKSAPHFSILAPQDDTSVIRQFGNLDRIPTVYLYDGSGQSRYSFIHQQDATKTHVTAAELIPHIEAILSTP